MLLPWSVVCVTKRLDQRPNEPDAQVVQTAQRLHGSRFCFARKAEALAALFSGMLQIAASISYPPAVDDVVALVGTELSSQAAGVRVQRPGTPQQT
jgi:anti-sigma factor ChrR (cupin superfamily)